jgi:hypothetical protein
LFVDEHPPSNHKRERFDLVSYFNDRREQYRSEMGVGSFRFHGIVKRVEAGSCGKELYLVGWMRGTERRRVEDGGILNQGRSIWDWLDDPSGGQLIPYSENSDFQ